MFKNHKVSLKTYFMLKDMVVIWQFIPYQIKHFYFIIGQRVSLYASQRTYIVLGWEPTPQKFNWYVSSNYDASLTETLFKLFLAKNFSLISPKSEHFRQQMPPKIQFLVEMIRKIFLFNQVRAKMFTDKGISTLGVREKLFYTDWIMEF